MNPLQAYLASRSLREDRMLNILQEHGVISDLCVMAADVAEGDCERAVEWLKGEWK